MEPGGPIPLPLDDVGAERPRAMIRFDSNYASRWKRPGIAQAFPAADDPRWGSSGQWGVPAPDLVFLLGETGQSILSTDGSVSMSKSGTDSWLRRRTSPDVLNDDDRSWGLSRGLEVPKLTGDLTLDAASSAVLNPTASFIAVAVRCDPRTWHDHSVKTLSRAEDADNLWSVSDSSDTAERNSRVKVGGVESLATVAVGRRPSLSLMAGGWDARSRKAWTAVNASTALGSALAGSSPSNAGTSKIAADGATDLSGKILWIGYWTGTDAEAVIDGWSSFAAAWWTHGKIPGLTVSATAIRAVSGELAELRRWWGAGQALVMGDADGGGLLVHPAVTTLSKLSQLLGDWDGTNILQDDAGADGPDGLRNATTLNEGSATGEHVCTQEVTLASSTTYTMIAYLVKRATPSNARGIFMRVALPSGDRACAVLDTTYQQTDGTVAVEVTEIGANADGDQMIRVAMTFTTAASGDDGVQVMTCGVCKEWLS